MGAVEVAAAAAVVVAVVVVHSGSRTGSNGVRRRGSTVVNSVCIPDTKAFFRSTRRRHSKNL